MKKFGDNKSAIKSNLWNEFLCFEITFSGVKNVIFTNFVWWGWDVDNFIEKDTG